MPVTKLSDQDKREIVIRVMQGESGTKLAEMYGVVYQRIYQVVHDAIDNAEVEAERAAEEHYFRQWVLKNTHNMNSKWTDSA